MWIKIRLRWQGIGHVLRIQPSDDPRKVLTWLPMGRRSGVEWQRRKGERSWGGRVGRRPTKWLLPCVPPRH